MATDQDTLRRGGLPSESAVLTFPGEEQLADAGKGEECPKAFRDRPVTMSAKEALGNLLPSILGLSSARVGCIALSYGSYRASDLGIATDGGTLVAVLVLIPFMLLLMKENRFVGRRLCRAIAIAGTFLQTAMLLAAAALYNLGVSLPSVAVVAIGAVSTLCFFGSAFFWLRHARGSSRPVATMFVFLAMALSVAIVYVLWLMPDTPAFVVAGIICALQLIFMRVARHREPIFAIRIASGGGSSRASANSGAPSSTFYLVTMAMGITIMGFAAGVLRGFPAGGAIGFLPGTRLLYSAITIVACLGITLVSLRWSGYVAAKTMWVVILDLAAFALILFAVFPGRLDIGASLANAVNALMIAVCLKTSISTSSVGRYDAYFYCIFCMTAYLGPRAVTRTVLSVMDITIANMSLIFTVVGMLLLFCSEVVLLRLASDPGARMPIENELLETDGEGALAPGVLSLDGREEGGDGSIARGRETEEFSAGMPEGQQRTGRRSSSLTQQVSRFLGIDGDLTPSELSELSLRQLVDEMARTFKLLDREEEVMLLYVQGATQARIAEQLGVSTNTAHAHIKHFYAKCNVHSRQELLDLMHAFESM